MVRTLTAALLLGALAPSIASAQPDDRSFVKSLVEAQKAWYERARERDDLVPGAFEVLRFPTGYVFKPRYKRDPSEPRRILNPDFFCTRCAKDKRIPAASDRAQHRLMQRDEPQVLHWIERELKPPRYTFIEDDTFKLYSDLPWVNLRNLRFDNNPFLKEELQELGDVFPEVTEKTVVIDDHQRAHLYLIRAHRLLRDFWWFAGTDNEKTRANYPWLGPFMGMLGKLEVFVFQTKRDYETFLDWFVGTKTVADGLCWHHLTDRAMLMAMHAESAEDPAVKNAFLHRLMHDFLDAYRMFSFKLPAWFQMGMAAWVERRENTYFNTFCFSEGTMPGVLYEDRWLPKIKKMVAKGRVTPFVEACNALEYGNFPPEYHMIAYSLFCYQLSLGPQRMRSFINALKDKKTEESMYQAQVRAFRDAYDLTLLQFEEGWTRFVLAVYPDV